MKYISGILLGIALTIFSFIGTIIDLIKNGEICDIIFRLIGISIRLIKMI